MLSIDFTFLFTAINLVVLFLFLRKFLFGRVTGFMDARSAKIQADLDQATAEKAQGDEYRKQHEALLKDAGAQRTQLLESAQQKAVAQYDSSVAQARAEASRILEEAHTNAQLEKQKALAEARDEIASLALTAASKVMAANMDNERNRNLVNSVLDELSDGGGVA